MSSQIFVSFPWTASRFMQEDAPYSDKRAGQAQSGGKKNMHNCRYRGYRVRRGGVRDPLTGLDAGLEGLSVCVRRFGRSAGLCCAPGRAGVSRPEPRLSAESRLRAALRLRCSRGRQRAHGGPASRQRDLRGRLGGWRRPESPPRLGRHRTRQWRQPGPVFRGPAPSTAAAGPARLRGPAQFCGPAGAGRPGTRGQRCLLSGRSCGQRSCPGRSRGQRRREPGPRPGRWRRSVRCPRGYPGRLAGRVRRLQHGASGQHAAGAGTGRHAQQRPGRRCPGQC